MRFRRSYRRGYGRRRRYGRRRARPNAARATNRTTFAPRHQYLKLKAAFSHTRASAVQNYAPIQLRMDIPYQPVNAATGWVLEGTTPPLGWNAYANLFQRYVVHGVKYQVKVYYQPVGSTVSNTQHPVTWAINTDVSSTATGSAVRALPISGSGVVSAERVWNFSRYFNLNRIMGVSVAKHDRFYHEWGETASNGHAYFRLVPETSSYNGLVVEWTVTYYLSAVSSNAVAGDPAAAAALMAFTEPYLGGENPEPDAAATQEVTNTGFTTNPRALKSVGLGGLKRSHSSSSSK